LIGDHEVTYGAGVDATSAEGAPREDEEDAPVFRALADPTRRALLDALHAADGQTMGELCALVPSMSRYGVGKHLQVLADARLLTTQWQGRTKRHFLNPVPIARIGDRWISKYAAPYTRALTDLERAVTGARAPARPAAPTDDPPPGRT
jgi:DNA-binding transcriptional ArsR family regulator